MKLTSKHLKTCKIFLKPIIPPLTYSMLHTMEAPAYKNVQCITHIRYLRIDWSENSISRAIIYSKL